MFVIQHETCYNMSITTNEIIMSNENGVYLSVVIPAYNEAKRIGKTLEAVDAYLDKQDYTSEVVVVIDGASDNTAAVVNGLKNRFERIVLVDRKQNRGKGYTVREGMLKASGQIRLFTDADNSTSIDQVANLLPYFKEDFDVVIGNRDMKGSNIAVPQVWYKELAGKLGNVVIQIVAVPGVSDTQCGFKAFSAKAAEEVFTRAVIDRWGFDVEALALARKFKFKIKQVPVTWINDPESHVKLSSYLQVFKETFQVRWGLLTGRYKEKKANPLE